MKKYKRRIAICRQMMCDTVGSMFDQFSICDPKECPQNHGGKCSIDGIKCMVHLYVKIRRIGSPGAQRSGGLTGYIFFSKGLQRYGKRTDFERIKYQRMGFEEYNYATRD